MPAPYRSAQGLPAVADEVARAVRPLLVPLVAAGLGRGTIAKQLNAIRVAGPGGGTWNKQAVARVLRRLALDDVRALARAARVAA